MRRLFLILTLGLLAGVLPPVAGASNATTVPRLYVGFQDDASFRWSEARAANLDRAADARVSVIRTTVTWAAVAPTRPVKASDPFDETYRFDDLDELVRGAQQRNIEVLLTIWGTPGWANGGTGLNRLPTRLSDLTAFTRALASRYSGRWAGYPHVRFYSIWNESNREQFLAPQYTTSGVFVAPVNYARLYRAAYAGIKSGNSTARVAIGETASNGRSVRLGRKGVQETSSPGRFVQLLGQQRPRLRFDAWAHHPYPTSSSAPPAQRFLWPGVGLSNLDQLGRALDKAFARRNTPIWITEYGHQTRGPGSVSPARQATYLAQALGLARANPRVGMFVWFVFRDETGAAWKSGVTSPSGAEAVVRPLPLDRRRGRCPQPRPHRRRRPAEHSPLGTAARLHLARRQPAVDELPGLEREPARHERLRHVGSRSRRLVRLARAVRAAGRAELPRRRRRHRAERPERLPHRHDLPRDPRPSAHALPSVLTAPARQCRRQGRRG
jgi:polysaccharide biosynthesis protein PslG